MRHQVFLTPDAYKVVHRKVTRILSNFEKLFITLAYQGDETVNLIPNLVNLFHKNLSPNIASCI